MSRQGGSEKKVIMVDVEPGEKTGVYYMPICNVRSQLSTNFFSQPPPSVSFIFCLFTVLSFFSGPNKFGALSNSCPLAHHGRTSRTGFVLIAMWTTWNCFSRVPRAGFVSVEKKTSIKHGVSFFSRPCLISTILILALLWL